MSTFMPLVHEARRAIRNRERGNPFTTDARLAALIDRLSAAYVATGNERFARLLHAELGRLETLI
jgi:hypothetical protein